VVGESRDGVSGKPRRLDERDQFRNRVAGTAGADPQVGWVVAKLDLVGSHEANYIAWFERRSCCCCRRFASSCCILVCLCLGVAGFGSSSRKTNATHHDQKGLLQTEGLPVFYRPHFFPEAPRLHELAGGNSDKQLRNEKNCPGGKNDVGQGVIPGLLGYFLVESRPG